MHFVNIGRGERRMRRFLGIGLLAMGTLLTWVLVAGGESPTWWWPPLFFAIYFVAVRFVVDAQTGVCMIKARRGERDMDGSLTFGGEPIRNQDEAAIIRHISRRGTIFAAIGAVLLMLVSMWTAGG
jgi:hypothetical protein